MMIGCVSQYHKNLDVRTLDMQTDGQSLDEHGKPSKIVPLKLYVLIHSLLFSSVSFIQHNYKQSNERDRGTMERVKLSLLLTKFLAKRKKNQPNFEKARPMLNPWKKNRLVSLDDLLPEIKVYTPTFTSTGLCKYVPWYCIPIHN